MITTRPGRDQRGFGLIELLLTLVAVALASYFLMQYVGSTTRTVEKAQKEHPELRIAGYRNGYFAESESGAIADAIKASNAD